MADFDGIIDPPAGNPDVPQLSVDAVARGGALGAMNAQAQALVARQKQAALDLADPTDPGKGAAMVGYEGRNLYLRAKDRLHINDYTRFVSDGDWAPAIEAMLTDAAGKTCYMERGGFYTIKRKIEYFGDIRLYAEGSVPAVIFQDGQSFDLAALGGADTLSATTTLTSPVQRGNMIWNVASTAGVEPGMLMTVKSAYSWYYDPRPESTDARKSELHRVSRVLNATQIVCELPAQDGYDAPAEVVAVTFRRPSYFDLKGVGFKAVQAPFSSSAPARTGLRLYRAVNAMIEEADAENTAAIGIWMSGCYRPEVLGGESRGINGLTGYGVQTYGCTLARIRGRKFFECNKAVDDSGGDIVSRMTVSEDCAITGGGFAYDGRTFGYADNGTTLGDEQYGMGTHGGSVDAVFRNNIFRDIYCCFSSHGTGTIYEGNRAYGRIPLFASITGGSHYFRRNYAGDGWWPDGDGTPYTYTGAFGINQFRNRRFVRVPGSGLKGELVLTENRVQINEHLISFQGTVTNFPHRILAKNNEICLATTTQTEATAALIGGSFDPVPTLSNVDLLDNTVVRDNGQAGGIATTYNVNLDASCRISNGGHYQGSYVPTLSTNANISSVSISGEKWNFARHGNQVVVWGAVTFAPTAAGACSFFVTVPIAPAVPASSSASGFATFNNTTNGTTDKETATVIWSTSSGGRLSVRANPGVTTSRTYQVQAVYTVS